MNKFKKEALRQHCEAREGLTPDQVAKLDAQQALAGKVGERARSIHAYLFDEEYAFMYADAFGEPRPSAETIMSKNAYRKEHGLPLLDHEGKAPDFQEATMEHCMNIARKEIVDQGLEDTSPFLERLQAELDDRVKSLHPEKKPFEFRASTPYMPGQFDAIYLEQELPSGCRLVAFDDDPYIAVAVLKGDEQLFTLLCANLNVTVAYIEANLDALVRDEV
ncbi:hypothetical protein [Marinobacterium weihaiense]|uniref:Uncharacterized protein n=1 Tax=Marinobacterium weihaiense TaxID=2851016 RepID=A0ABS6MCM8_9GAMM|nr:hypothetical protein [Marinobacterium weihaiense]MBV0933596.1 hypothetical protein [Marinobacterium weihaiense]